MISKGQFIEAWDELEGSFGRTFPARVKDAWFRELEDTEFLPFKSTMRALCMGSHWRDGAHTFPKYPDFWNIYRHKKKFFSKEKEPEPCGKCRHGVIHFYGPADTRGHRAECAAFCRNCRPNYSGAVDPDQEFDYLPGMEPERYRKVFMINPTVALGMLDDIKKNLFRKGYDWEKAEVEAWAMHYQAVGGKKI